MKQRGLEFDNDGWRIFLDTATAAWPTLASGQNLMGFVSGAPTIKNSSTTYELVTPTGTQTLTNKTLTSPVLTTPQINDTSADHQYIFAVSELAADRTVTLPLLAGNDVFVFADFIQTLTNKTISADSNTLSGIAASSFVLSNGSGNIDGAASQKAIPSGVVVGTTDTQTLTNKRVTPRIFTLTDAATIAVDADTTDIGVVTLGGNRTLDNPTGTPTDGQELIIRVRQDATAGRTLAYDTKYRFTGASAPTVTATANETSYLRFMYHSGDDKWDLISSALDFRT